MWKRVTAPFVLALSFVTCSHSQEAAVPTPSQGASVKAVAYGADQVATAVPAKRMIVQTATLRLIVKDVPGALEAVKKLVAAQNGYIATSRSWKENGQPSSEVTLRVPSEKLEPTLAQLRALALDVDSDSLSGEDVTEEYIDLQASLRNEQAYERELLELLTETRRKTGNADDLLAVYNRVNEVRGRIEKMQGRIQYLEKTSAMATINLELIPSSLAEPISVAGWHPTGTVRTATRVLLRALQVLVDIVIVLAIVALPIALIVLLPVFGALRLFRRRRTAPLSGPAV